jgi:DNA-binding transcriptional regulator YbjK
VPTERGERRRGALLEAAAALLEEQGFAAVSHRAVAARAGLPLAATTYYFASREQLVEEAVRHGAERHLEAARARAAEIGFADAAPERLAAAIVDLVAGDADEARLLTIYERYVQAGRHPGLRAQATAWTEELVTLVADALTRTGRDSDRARARRLVALADGLLISGLVAGDGRAAERARQDLAEALTDG